ncbi:nicotinamide-nucleotide adenylyltransferase [Malassezia cuniculi]|uniref:Nicotinamide-nucleotide adenylyltransferase n=1 Tax=Malassezia cuniculi TaxID=948313 RepID=A0AAF0J8C3_9BASI|nr:nicotinamide-nucleotide adenylyltransferase [Malassezia cuniculi]
MSHAAAAPAAPLRVVYATRPRWPGKANARIAVLDSSFNPPTRAHLALATLGVDDRTEFDAHLLIYSVRNADKGFGSGASLAQRAEMMTCLARDVEDCLKQRSPHHEPNVAVALVDEPLVFAKSTLVHSYVNDSPRLFWVVGSDTLTRVFNPKYYASQDDLAARSERFFGQEGTSMICVDRPQQQGSSHDDAIDDLFAHSAVARAWRDAGRIELRTIGAQEATYSSTKQRRCYPPV